MLIDLDLRAHPVRNLQQAWLDVCLYPGTVVEIKAYCHHIE